MDIHKLDDMVRGWFVGNFDPSVLKTNDVEVAIKRYTQGADEEPHFHKVATEITVIVEGVAMMGDRELRAGDIAVIRPGEVTGFRALTDVVTAVVKVPGAGNDKYPAP